MIDVGKMRLKLILLSYNNFSVCVFSSFSASVTADGNDKSFKNSEYWVAHTHTGSYQVQW